MLAPEIARPSRRAQWAAVPHHQGGDDLRLERHRGQDGSRRARAHQAGRDRVGESTIVSLKRFKDDVREVLQGLECGIGVEGIRGVSPNDVIEAFTTEEVARTL